MQKKSYNSGQPPSTLFVGQFYRYLPVAGSTNAILKTQLTAEPLPEGAVISAGYQTEGRGQAGTTWESAGDSNITLSVLLHPRFMTAANQFQLSKAIALAVRDFIAVFVQNEPVAIKWPNDILVSGKKICGILIENGLKGEQIEYSVCGIGININELPKDHARTSLKTITGIDYDLRYLEKKLFSHIEARYLQLRAHAEAISEDYLNALYGFNHQWQYEDLTTHEVFQGSIEGIHTDGRLMVTTREGIKLFSLKEIRLAGR